MFFHLSSEIVYKRHHLSFFSHKSGFLLYFVRKEVNPFASIFTRKRKRKARALLFTSSSDNTDEDESGEVFKKDQRNSDQETKDRNYLKHYSTCLSLTSKLEIVSHVIPRLYPNSDDVKTNKLNPFVKFKSLRLFLSGILIHMVHRFDSVTKQTKPKGSPLRLNQITTLSSVGEEYLFMADASLELAQFGHPLGPNMLLDVNNLASLSFMGCKFDKLIRNGELHKILPSPARIHLGSGISLIILPDPFSNVKICSYTDHFFITKHEFCELYRLACDYRLMFPYSRHVLPCAYTHPNISDIHECQLCNSVPIY